MNKHEIKALIVELQKQIKEPSKATAELNFAKVKADFEQKFKCVVSNGTASEYTKKDGSKTKIIKASYRTPSGNNKILNCSAYRFWTTE